MGFTMLKVKKCLCVVARFFILGPLAVVAVLGQWAEEAFEYLDPLMGEEDAD
ncbi:hypothetical protein [Pectobacterium phage Peat1]|uniref:Uncharacterized protein n=1 Tax=Pectobacterium phage Peat1 TaxID=1654601 RepID=A0A0H3YJ60_9CAUD|nr:hypothetical protein AXI77_gp15 [Pectobacterium phage Peat1]AKN21172.1 hypothetical protein [Pectobacterium phage Peat1]